MKLLTVENMTVSYEGHTVFHNLSFTVNEGDCLCVLGENGSGKTTLMRCILGLHTRFSGTVSCHGFTANEIGWLPQRGGGRPDFPASVFEVVLSGFSGKERLGLRCSAARRREAQQNMELLGISGLKHHSFQELSGGQQQKVLLCRALCAADRVLLLDEPATGLDSASQSELYALIRKLHRGGMTIIMISHDVERALDEADRILHIAEDGYCFCTPQDYRETTYYRDIRGKER